MSVVAPSLSTAKPNSKQQRRKERALQAAVRSTCSLHLPPPLRADPVPRVHSAGPEATIGEVDEPVVQSPDKGVRPGFLWHRERALGHYQAHVRGEPHHDGALPLLPHSRAVMVDRGPLSLFMLLTRSRLWTCQCCFWGCSRSEGCSCARWAITSTSTFPVGRACSRRWESSTARARPAGRFSRTSTRATHLSLSL
jgi:hypothetical protein